MFFMRFFSVGLYKKHPDFSVGVLGLFCDEFNDHAGVVFALRGITPELCVEEALLGMMHRKTIIVPSAFMRLCTSAQRLVPIPLLMPIVARQQKKKLG